MSKFKITKNLSHLSYLELVTLQKLIDHRQPVVRFILYQEINQFVNPNRITNSGEEIFIDTFQQPNLSTSSFYNSLKTLEADGLVLFIKKKQKGIDKIIAVEATEKAKLVIKGITGHFLTMTIDDVNYMIKIFSEIMKRIGITHISNTLIVNLKETIDNRLMELGFRLSDEIYLLANKGIYESMIKMGFDKLKSTVMFDNRIREPNDIFEVSLVPEYEKEPDFFGLSRIAMLKELIRVVKPGGTVAIIARSKIPQGDNFYAKVLLNKFEESISGRIFTEEEIKEDLKAAGFTQYEILDFQGVIVAVGWV